MHQFVLLCLDRATGKVLWQQVACEQVPHEGSHQDGTFASSSGVTDGKHVWAYFGSRGIYCYDFHDGCEVRDETRAGEPEMTDRLPAMLGNALSLLEHAGPAPAVAAALAEPARTGGQEAAADLLRLVREPFPAPPLALPDLDGRNVDLGAHGGQVVLVNFWATWCPPCVEEIPSLDRLRQGLAPRGCEVLAVDVGEPRDQVKALLEARPVRFPVLLDATGETFKRWKAYAFPTSLLLDRRHRFPFLQEII